MPDFGWNRLQTAWDSYTKSDLPFVKFGKTAGTLFGIIVLAVNKSVAEVIDAFATEFILRPATGITSFAVDVLEAIFYGVTTPAGFDGVVWRAPVTASNAFFRQSAEFISNLGPVGFVAGVVIVLSMSYVALNWRGQIG